MKHTVNRRIAPVDCYCLHRAAFIALLNQLFDSYQRTKNAGDIYDVCLFHRRPFCAGEELKSERKAGDEESPCQSHKILSRVFFNFPFRLKLLYRKCEYKEMRYISVGFFFHLRFPFNVIEWRTEKYRLFEFFLYFLHFFRFNYHAQKHTYTSPCLLSDLLLYIVRYTIHFPNYNPIIVWLFENCCVFVSL